MIRPLTVEVYLVMVQSVNTEGKLPVGSLMFVPVPPFRHFWVTVAPFPVSEATVKPPADSTEWRLLPLVSLRTCSSACPLAACQRAHGGLTLKSFSHVEHESQVVDPGREYWDAGHVWQEVAREVLVKVPGGHGKHLHVPSACWPGKQSPHCNAHASHSLCLC
jgi:hypothetical protein